MVDTLWIARHGNRQDFVDSEWIKSAKRPYDPGLSSDGILQAKQLAARMRDLNLEAVFASPFLRTIETAHYIADAVECAIYIEPGLSEWLNPEWFPATPKTIPSPELARRFRRVDLSYVPLSRATYGETEGEAMRRSADAARAIASHYDGSVAIVGHSVSVMGTARGLVPDARVPECGMRCLFKLVPNGEGWQMEICADDSHLREPVAAEIR